MDPINGVLDETFFKVASPECLTALSKLIDDALAVRFTNYLNSTTVDNPIAAIINNYLGQAIKMATFHMQLLERGSAKVVEKIELETIANMRFDQRAVIEELEFLEKNIKYVRSFLEPRRKAGLRCLRGSAASRLQNKGRKQPSDVLPAPCKDAQHRGWHHQPEA